MIVNQRKFPKESDLLLLNRIFFLRIKMLIYLIVLSYFAFSAFQSGIKNGYQLLYLMIGFFSYSVIEYSTHRWTFHGPIPKNKYLYTLLYYWHLGHHDDPKNINFLFAPIYLTLFVLALVTTLLLEFNSDLVFNYLFLTGFVMSYIFYEWNHFMFHSARKFKGKLMSKAQELHLQHHFKNEYHWLAVAVTTIPLDHLFFTSAAKDEVPLSKTARLGGVLKDDPRLHFAREVKEKVIYL